MSYDLTNDSEQVPGPPLPGISQALLNRIRRWAMVCIVLAVVGVWAWWMIGVYADWLWFGQLGYSAVFIRIMFIKTVLFAFGALLAALIISFNLYTALRLSIGPTTRALPSDFVRLLLLILRLYIILTMLIASLALGSVAAERWDVALLLLNRELFGVSDPQFGRDVTFYLVNLEIMRFIQSWFLALFITVIISSLALYAGIYALRGVRFVVTPRMLRHMAPLGATLMVIIAVGHVASIYGLTLSESGVVTGATYTDVNARIPVFWFLAGIALLAAVGFGVSVYFAGLRLMVGAFSLWLLMFLLAGILYPILFQRFLVDPDQYAREEPFIQRNLEATRAAYGLNDIEETTYSAAESLTLAVAQEHRTTLDSIRLWDAAPLQDAYNQLQFMELYYNFLNMDSDRYVVDGRLQQVLIGARELDPTNLPTDAQNWVNQRLQYTHGYGVAMTPAAGFTPGEGRPEFFIQDIPIQGKLPVSRPEVYYGESPINFAIVNSGMSEVNPSSDFESYDGKGGVGLHSLVRRVVYAIEFRDINILLSDQVEPTSRIQYRRQVRERVKAIAPFLKLDHDPYPALDDNGKLWWIQDAYTVTDHYPYATPSGDGFNYIRNSVKAVVDAYNGDVALYVVDPEEPLLKMYRRAFPDLFREMAAMPPDLLRHIRYPVTLFSVQAQLYLRYHVTDPQVFFNQAEQWDIPLETRFGKPGVRVTPSYLLMRLPGVEREEFVLLMPFSPAGQKKNLVGWLAARNDPPHYGQLKSFHLPDDRQIDGPSQVEARIQNDQQFSQLFTLWDGPSSKVIRGKLLAIPIADTIVYVEPLYLQSVGLAFPELKKVILADNTNLVMADSMAEALARLLGAEYNPAETAGTVGTVNKEAATGATTTTAAGAEPLIQEPSIQWEQLEQIEATVNELGQALEDLEKSLENLRRTLGGDSP